MWLQKALRLLNEVVFLAGGLQKAVAIVGGLVIGVGVTYLIRTVLPYSLADEVWIGIGILLTISAGVSLYYMTKSSS